MATVLKREGGVVRTRYECPYCQDEDTAEHVESEGPSRRPADAEAEEPKGSHPVEDAKA